MCEKGGLCILRIHDIFSACVVWFTFVSRTQEHRAVGSSGIGLTDSRGSFPLWDCLSLTSWVKYNILNSVCQEVFWTFLFGREILFYFTQLRIGERLFAPVCLLTSLLYHTLMGLSRGFFEKLEFFYSLLLRTVRALLIAPTKRFIRGNGNLPHTLWEVSHLFPSWQL